MVSEIKELLKSAKQASYVLAAASTETKNKALDAVAEELKKQEKKILAANKIDLENLQKKEGYNEAFYDRLLLNSQRIEAMAEGIKDIAALPDPVGEIESMSRRPNGLLVGRMRTPLGVVGIIYEARPNVTVDAAGLSLKSGNAVVLRGSSEALNSNIALVKVLTDALGSCGIPEGSVILIRNTDRAAVRELMRMNRYLDVLIPRGGPALIQTVIENATVPVIQTGAGNCHTYIDKNADAEMAISIVVNAKTHRPGVCNALETLLVHEQIADKVLPTIIDSLIANHVEIRGCELTRKYHEAVKPADEEDWLTEYLSLVLAIRIVRDMQEAIDHIHEYGTGHSECIVTKDYHRSREFLQLVDAAAVYVNASTRFTDGFEFGLGGEMGISTQKLHARGPMGLNALTGLKYIVFGDGQIRS